MEAGAGQYLTNLGLKQISLCIPSIIWPNEPKEGRMAEVFTVEDSMSRLQELESLTRSYACFSRSAGGLGSVLGGALCLLSYFLGALLPLTPALQAGLIAIPFVWLLCKGWLVRRYYQRFGRAEEMQTKLERTLHRFYFGFALLISLVIAAFVLAKLLSEPGTIAVGTVAYLVLILTIPVAAWFWLRSSLDFVIGVFLFCQASMISVGLAYPLIGMTETTASTGLSLIAVIFPLATCVAIYAGVAEHRQFSVLRARIDELRGLSAVE